MLTLAALMRKEDAIAVAGSNKALADLLGISVHAIYQWGVTIPRLREYQLREKIPDFDARLAALRKLQAADPVPQRAAA
jgi:hypothetical protein